MFFLLFPRSRAARAPAIDKAAELAAACTSDGRIGRGQTGECVRHDEAACAFFSGNPYGLRRPDARIGRWQAGGCVRNGKGDPHLFRGIPRRVVAAWRSSHLLSPPLPSRPLLSSPLLSYLLQCRCGCLPPAALCIAAPSGKELAPAVRRVARRDNPKRTNGHRRTNGNGRRS